MQAVFRLAQRADLELLLELVREYYEFDGHTYEREPVRAAIDALLHDRSLGRIWLICDEQEPIGYVVLAFGYSIEYRGRDAFVDEVYLREPYRGRGIGTQTFAFLEQASRDLGVRALHLEVEHHNTSAQHFYRVVGFRDQERYLMTKLL